MCVYESLSICIMKKINLIVENVIYIMYIYIYIWGVGVGVSVSVSSNALFCTYVRSFAVE